MYQIKKMFYHPVYSFMLADVDYFIELPNGKTAILEIKTTNYNAKDNWWIDGIECVPVYYELQGRHYMCVMNLDEVYFCCLYGNNENEVIIRHITRDKDYEDELIGLESNFWHNHVQRHIPPPYEEEDGELIIESARRHYNDTLPENYHGRSISPSDVVELYDEEKRRCFYRDRDSFCPVKFSPFLAKPMKQG